MEKECIEGKELLTKIYSALKGQDKDYKQIKLLLEKSQKCILKRQTHITGGIVGLFWGEFTDLNYSDIGNWRGYPFDFYVERKAVFAGRGPQGDLCVYISHESLDKDDSGHVYYLRHIIPEDFFDDDFAKKTLNDFREYCIKLIKEKKHGKEVH